MCSFHNKRKHVPPTNGLARSLSATVVTLTTSLRGLHSRYSDHFFFFLTIELFHLSVPESNTKPYVARQWTEALNISSMQWLRFFCRAEKCWVITLLLSFVLFRKFIKHESKDKRPCLLRLIYSYDNSLIRRYRYAEYGYDSHGEQATGNSFTQDLETVATSLVWRHGTNTSGALVYLSYNGDGHIFEIITLPLIILVRWLTCFKH